MKMVGEKKTPEEKLDYLIEQAALHKQLGKEEADILTDLTAADILRSLMIMDDGNENHYPFIILKEPLMEGDRHYEFIKAWLAAGKE